MPRRRRARSSPANGGRVAAEQLVAALAVEQHGHAGCLGAAWFTRHCA